jgi:hypothetical protein
MKNEEIIDWKEQQIKQLFKQNKLLKKKPEKIIKEIINNKISLNDLPANSFVRKLFLNTTTETDFKNQTVIDLDLVLIILKNKCEEILEDKRYFNALTEITKYKNNWIRNVNNWKRPSHNVHKQIENLIEHLFIKYKMPKFLNNCWFENNNIDYNVKVFLHVTSGLNLRKFSELPFDLTKKMAHEFMSAPDSYNLNEAFIWAIVKSFGGDERMVQIINGTDLLSKINSRTISKQAKDFWINIIEFFSKNSMIDPEKVSPIIDYIYHIKFEKERVWENGILKLNEPENPNFTIKGKNIERLIEKTEDWHNKLNKENKTKSYLPKSWKGYDFENFQMEEGKEKNKRIYQICQLLTQNELSQEGKAMNHCVFSYAKSCANGNCSIWSLRYADLGGIMHRMVTIELKGHDIVQIRGRYNRKVDGKEMYIIQKWATKEGLSISKWC